MKRWIEVKQTGSIPSPRRDHCSILNGEYLYLFGGKNRASYCEASMFIFNCGKAACPVLSFTVTSASLPVSQDQVLFKKTEGIGSVWTAGFNGHGQV
jgi:hypothetical protein